MNAIKQILECNGTNTGMEWNKYWIILKQVLECKYWSNQKTVFLHPLYFKQAKHLIEIVRQVVKVEVVGRIKCNLWEKFMWASNQLRRYIPHLCSCRSDYVGVDLILRGARKPGVFCDKNNLFVTLGKGFAWTEDTITLLLEQERRNHT